MPANVTLLSHFSRLGDFKGREDRSSFWPYAALVLIIVIVAGTLIFVPMMMQTMAAMQQYAAEHPNEVTSVSGPGHYSVSVEGHHPELFSTSGMYIYLGVMFGLALLLYAAAVTRRLHDSGRPGFWGVMPLPFVLYSTIMMPQIFGSPAEPGMGLFFSVFFSNLLYMIALIWLIVLLAMPSDASPNRYDVSQGATS